MGCDRCDELFDTYQRSVGLLRNAVRRVAVAQGPDHWLAVQEMTRLQETCRDANDVLREQLRQAHTPNQHSES